MEHATDMLPKNVQKQIKRLADIQRKEVALLQASQKSEKQEKEIDRKLNDLFDKGSKVIEELFSTRFAAIDLGIGWDEDATYAEDLHHFAAYFLSLYTMERLAAEVCGETCDEDLFYAAALLMHRSTVAAQADNEDDYDDYDPDEDEYDRFLNRMTEESGDKPDALAEPKIVPLFGEKKGKNNEKK